MTTPVPVVYFAQGEDVLHNSDEGILHLSAPMVVGPARASVVVEPGNAPPAASMAPGQPKRRGRPRKTAATHTTVAKPEPVVDVASRAKVLEACRRYLDIYPRGGYLARWFREGKQDLREAEIQARTRDDLRTADLAAQLHGLGSARSKVHAALALPRDFGRVKPESAP